MRLSAPLVLALVGSVTSSGESFGARAVVDSGCAEAAALAATGDLRSARRLAIQLIGPGSGLETRRTCSEQWRAATDPELGSFTKFVTKMRQSQSHLGQPDLASSAPSKTVDRPEPRCWWNQNDPGSISTPSWSKCCAEVDPEDAGRPADPAVCFGKGGKGGSNGSAGSEARVWCCGFGPGTDSYAAIPALLEPFISVRLPGPGGRGRVLRLQQGGFLRAFDLATVLWPAGFVLAQHVASVCSGRDRWRGRTVLELGAGIGLPSLAAAECGAVVTATDLEDRALALIEANALDNGLVVTSRRFDWSSDRMLRELVAAAPAGGFDVVMGAALMFEGWQDRLWPLLQSLTHSGSSIILCHTHGVLSPPMRSGLQLITRLPAASVLGSALWYDFEIVVAGHSNRSGVAPWPWSSRTAATADRWPGQ